MQTGSLVVAAAVGLLTALIFLGLHLRARRWRRTLWLAMTAQGSRETAAVGLLTEGSFAAPGLLAQRRFPHEGPLSWVGVVVRDGCVEIWELQRPFGGRPLKVEATPTRIFSLGADNAVAADVRADTDRLFPRLWIRWMAREQLACAGFVPMRENALLRRSLEESRFSSLATALTEVLPTRLSETTP